MNDDADARARIGTVLNDKWTLEKLLGVGGMGAVYAGRHRNGARAAVKVLHADLARYADVRERFLREGYAANKVEHPGAVKVIDDDLITSGPDSGTAYLVMELLIGESLEDRVERGPKVSEREFLTVADAVLDVLTAAHARGVVHRDLKPENVFLARDDTSGETRVKVLDFGLARLLDAHTTTMQGVAVGTPSYMSPEQASGRHAELDGRSDLFSLAASGFRLVTGRRIHEGESPVILVTKMANMPAPKLRDVSPGASVPFARVIDRALMFNREDRYADAAAMREDVRLALLEMGPLVREGTPLGDAPTLVAMAPVFAPLSVRPQEPIELSARDLRSLDDGVTVRTLDDARPTTPVSPKLPSAIAEEAPTVVRVPKLGAAPPAIAPDLPTKRMPAPAPKSKPSLPEGPKSPRVPSRSPPPLPPPRVPKTLEAPIAATPKRRRTSFIPVLTVVLLAGIALKLALDAQPDPRSEASRDPLAPPDDSAHALDAAARDTSDAALIFASSATILPDASAADDSGDAGDAGDDDAQDAAIDDAGADALESTLATFEADYEIDAALDDAGAHDPARVPLAAHSAAPNAAHSGARPPATKPRPPAPKHPAHDPAHDPARRRGTHGN